MPQNVPAAANAWSDADLLAAFDSPEFDAVADTLTPQEGSRLKALVDAREKAAPPAKPKGRFDDLPPEGPGRVVGQALDVNNPKGMLDLLADLGSLIFPPSMAELPPGVDRQLFNEAAAKQRAEAPGHLKDAGKGLFEALVASPSRELTAALMPDGSLAPPRDAAERDARLRHLVSAVPIFGPGAVDSYDMLQEGRPYSAAGNVLGYGAQLVSPRALMGRSLPVVPRTMGYFQRGLKPAEVAQQAAARAAGVDLPIALRTKNPWLLRQHARTAQTAAGEKLATEQAQRVADQTQAWAERLQQRILPGAERVTKDEAGQAFQDQFLRQKQTAQGQQRQHYGYLEETQANPLMQEDVPVPLPAYVRKNMIKAVGSVPDQDILFGMRRIAEELDNQQYSPRMFEEAGPGRGGDLEVVKGRTPNAGVYGDIRIHAPGTSEMTGVEMSRAINKALDTGIFTNAAHGAYEVARLRLAGKTGSSLPFGGKGYLPPEAGRLATPLMSMEWPVDLSMARPQLRKLLDAVEGGMPAAEKAASKGLVALRSIVNGPDYVPLMSVQKELSAIGELAGVSKSGIKTSGEGLAAQAYGELQRAFQAALQKGGPEAVSALRRGNAATMRAHLADDLLQKLPRPEKYGGGESGVVREGVGTYERVITPGDRNIKRLRKIAVVAPDQIPIAGRAFFDAGLEEATAGGAFDFGKAQKLVGDWRALGPKTKQLVIARGTKQGPQMVREIDHLMDTIEDLGTRHEPVIVGQTTAAAVPAAFGAAVASGSPAVGATVGAVMFAKNAVTGLARVPMANLLYTPGGAKLIEQGFRIPLGDTARVAAWNARVTRALAAAERLPMVADDRSDTPTAR